MSIEQEKKVTIQEEFHKKAIDFINAKFDAELLKKSFFTSRKSIENARFSELRHHQNIMDGLKKKQMPLPLTDIVTGRNDTYLQSVKIINDYFDKKLLKKSLFSSIIAIQMARKIELEKIENKFFNKQLRS